MEKKKYVLNKVILIALCVVCGLMTFVDFYLSFDDGFRALNLIRGLIFLAIIYYAIFAYKKPHGNEFRYIILITVFFTLIQTTFEHMGDHGGEATVVVVLKDALIFLSAVLMAFVAGRLDRIKQNKIIFLIVLALLVAFIIVSSIKIDPGISADVETLDTPMPPMGNSFKVCLLTVTRFATLIQYLSLMVAYLCRYQLHKEAGMKDK